MKEDVLEQIVDDYLQKDGYFTIHNVRYRPNSFTKGYKVASHSVHSDIDLIGWNPNKRGSNRAVVVTCKSWQGGFDAEWWAQHAFSSKKAAGRPAWKMFRELTDPQWNAAFFEKVKSLTGTTKFTYITAVTRLKGDADAWQLQRKCLTSLRGNPIRILTLAEIFETFQDENLKTPAPSHLGRLVQLLHSAQVFVAESPA